MKIRRIFIINTLLLCLSLNLSCSNNLNDKPMKSLILTSFFLLNQSINSEINAIENNFVEISEDCRDVFQKNTILSKLLNNQLKNGNSCTLDNKCKTLLIDSYLGENWKPYEYLYIAEKRKKEEKNFFCGRNINCSFITSFIDAKIKDILKENNQLINSILKYENKTGQFFEFPIQIDLKKMIYSFKNKRLECLINHSLKKDVNKVDSQGFLPVLYPILLNRTETVELIINSKYFDLAAKDNFGDTIYDYLRGTHMESKILPTLFYSKKFDPNIYLKNGMAIIHYLASKILHPHVYIAFFSSPKIKIDIKDKIFNRNALTFAVINNNNEFILKMCWVTPNHLVNLNIKHKDIFGKEADDYVRNGLRLPYTSNRICGMVDISFCYEGYEWIGTLSQWINDRKENVKEIYEQRKQRKIRTIGWWHSRNPTRQYEVPNPTPEKKYSLSPTRAWEKDVSTLHLASMKELHW